MCGRAEQSNSEYNANSVAEIFAVDAMPNLATLKLSDCTRYMSSLANVFRIASQRATRRSNCIVSLDFDYLKWKKKMHNVCVCVWVE